MNLKKNNIFILKYKHKNNQKENFPHRVHKSFYIFSYWVPYLIQDFDYPVEPSRTESHNIISNNYI